MRRKLRKRRTRERRAKRIEWAYSCLVVGAAALLLVAVLTFATSQQRADAGRVGNYIVQVGKQYLGTPYSQMNCSQFTRLVYGRSVGVWMAASFVSQRYYGYAPRHVRRGDLLLYRDHVGIYAGRGRILHSSSYYGRVVISETRWLHGYLGARRIR